MTKKRFMVDDAGTLIDMETRNTYDYVTDIVELLNELNNENTMIKEEIKDFQDLLANKENELLKPVLLQIEEAIETERTAIGKSVLKQLYESLE